MANEITPASVQALRHATANEIQDATTTVHEVHKAVADANSELETLYSTLKQTEKTVARYNYMSRLCRDKMHNLGMMLDQ